jgi:head-tail adaptor
MENRINFGELDTLITVQAVTQSLGDRGQRTVSVTKYADVYAKLDRRVNESVDDGNLESGEVIDVLMYKIKALTSRWRLLISGVPYEILSIDPIDRFSPLNILTVKTIQK